MSSAGNQKNYICYYSNRCKFCEHFLKELATMPLKTQFHFICVDPSTSRPAIPQSITQVPALILKGEPTPLLGNDAINWLATAKLQMAPSRGPGGTKPPNPEGMPEEPEAYFASEMGGGYSSAFTYINNQFEEMGGTIGNFEYLGGGGAGVSTNMGGAMLGPGGISNQQTGLSDQGSKKVSAKEQLLQKQMDEYMARRDSGIPQVVKRQ